MKSLVEMESHWPHWEARGASALISVGAARAGRRHMSKGRNFIAGILDSFVQRVLGGNRGKDWMKCSYDSMTSARF